MTAQDLIHTMIDLGAEDRAQILNALCDGELLGQLGIYDVELVEEACALAQELPT